MKVSEIFKEGNMGPADDMSIEGPFDISSPAGEQEESDDEDYADDQQDEEGEFTCNQCNGSGEGMYDGSRCRMCGGAGVIRNHEEEDPDYLRDKDQDDRMTGHGRYADDGADFDE